MSERVPHFVTSLLQLYKRQGGGAVLEITLCLSPLLHLAVTTSASPALDTVLDPLFNTMFQQVCIPMDFERPGTVKNHHEMLRCYDTMMRHSPSKLVQGLLVKADSGEERLRVGALMVIKHILNMSTAELGEQLEAILEHLAAKLQETNPNVQKVLAQIIVLLGSHGSISGARGRDLVAFIVRLCGAEDSKPTTLTTESLGVICSNILQLLATSVPSAEEVLWPHTLDALLQVDCEGGVPAVARALAHVVARRVEEGRSITVDWGDFTHAVGPSPLLARLVVLAAVPSPGARGVHILRLLLPFSPNINRHLGAVWEARFPLLLHYLEQQGGGGDSSQWQAWLLDLVR